MMKVEEIELDMRVAASLLYHNHNALRLRLDEQTVNRDSGFLRTGYMWPSWADEMQSILPRLARLILDNDIEALAFKRDYDVALVKRRLTS